MRPGWLRRGGALIAVIGLASSTAPALAETSNRYTVVGLSAVTLAPTDFTIQVIGTNPVCSMRFGKVERTQAPWTFTIDPTISARTVQVRVCDQSSVYTIYLDTVVPWRVQPALHFRELLPQARAALYITSDLDERAEVKIVAPSGEIVGLGTSQPMTVSSISFRASSMAPLAQYSVRITSALTRTTMNLTTTVGNGWVAADEEPAFPRCATIAWFYDRTGAPPRIKAASIRKDIAGALSRISQETGLTFVEAKNRLSLEGGHRLTFEWSYRGLEPTSSTLREVTRGDSVSLAGVVRLNPRHWWLRSEAYSGFALVRRPKVIAGRGWLFVRESLRVVGLSRTKDGAQLMGPRLTRQISFGEGDRAGLRYLYRPSGCTQ